MLVDPFTVAAQIVNFLILVAALKFLLYDRITSAMDARQQRISEQFSRAEQREEEAERAARRHEEELEELQRERDRHLQDAEREAAERRDELVTEARRDVAELEERWLDAVERERARLLQQLREGTADRVMHITRRVLADLADETLEERIVDVFVDRLADADPDELRAADSHPVEVRSTFELDDGGRDRLEAAVRKHVDGTAEVHFTHDPELLGGVELYVDGHALGWNIAAYLDEVEGSLRELLGGAGGRR